MANGDEKNRKIDKTDVQIAREQLEVLKQTFGITVKTTTQEQVRLNLAKQAVTSAQNYLALEEEREGIARKEEAILKDINKAKSLSAKISSEIKN